MRTVGLRELKNQLSEYIRKVRAGETILVTDRGEVVAEIKPPGQTESDSSLPAGLLEMARKGLVRLGGKNDPSAYPRMAALLSAEELADLLNEERGER
jgi:antitoxin (DNA-binding transcriptional repressor) of toxin-antitoxin stability system